MPPICRSAILISPRPAPLSFQLPAQCGLGFGGVNQNRSPQVAASFQVSCRFCCQLATIAANRMPPLQPKIPHSTPVGPRPNVLPGVAGDGLAEPTTGDNASDAARMAAMIFGCLIGFLLSTDIR